MNRLFGNKSEINNDNKANKTDKYKADKHKIDKIRTVIDQADAVIIGAGAGLSTSAGFTYSGERFEKYFSDFGSKYGFKDMYSGGFYPYDTLEEYWAYWSRYIYINRYMDASKPVYDRLFELVHDKDYFVLTTNVDHCFQKAGFDKKRLFYTQGDYGLFQCSKPCSKETYDNEEIVRKMLISQGYTFDETGTLVLNVETSDGKNTDLFLDDAIQKTQISQKMHIKSSTPTALIPKCPHCGRPMTMNLRADDTFVEDEGWHEAAERYDNFLRTRKNLKIVFLELGVGYNTPGIIKYPFWQMTMSNYKATYVCINYGEAAAPREIESQSICVDGDIGEVLDLLN